MSRTFHFAFYTSNRGTRLCRYLAGDFVHKESIRLVVHDGAHSDELQTLCRRFGIHFFSVDYAALQLTGTQKNSYISDFLLEKFQQFDIHHAFCFGSRLLKGNLLEEYRNRIINFHPALLPSFPGRKSIDQALAAGALMLGNTAHFIDEGTDSGPIIMQSFLPAAKFTDYDSVLDLQLPMLQQLICWLIDKRLLIDDNNRVSIKNARYSALDFLPNLDFI